MSEKGCTGETSGLSMAESEVIHLRRDHAKTWRDQPETYWLARLMEEVGELAASIVGDHDDPPEWELKQIASICINWLDMNLHREEDD